MLHHGKILLSDWQVGTCAYFSHVLRRSSPFYSRSTLLRIINQKYTKRAKWTNQHVNLEWLTVVLGVNSLIWTDHLEVPPLSLHLRLVISHFVSIFLVQRRLHLFAALNKVCLEKEKSHSLKPATSLFLYHQEIFTKPLTLNASEYPWYKRVIKEALLHHHYLRIIWCREPC